MFAHDSAACQDDLLLHYSCRTTPQPSPRQVAEWGLDFAAVYAHPCDASTNRTALPNCFSTTACNSDRVGACQRLPPAPPQKVRHLQLTWSRLAKALATISCVPYVRVVAVALCHPWGERRGDAIERGRGEHSSRMTSTDSVRGECEDDRMRKPCVAINAPGALAHDAAARALAAVIREIVSSRPLPWPPNWYVLLNTDIHGTCRSHNRIDVDVSLRHPGCASKIVCRLQVCSLLMSIWGGDTPRAELNCAPLSKPFTR